MNRVITLVAAVLMAAMLASCGPNDTEKALDGKWETANIVDEDGFESKIVFSFDAKEHKGKMVIKLAISDFGELMEINTNFKWSADAKKLTIDYEGDPEMELDNPVISQLGLSKSEIEDDFLAHGNLAGKDEYRIISLTDTKLVVKDEDPDEEQNLGVLTLIRIGRSRYDLDKKSKENASVAEDDELAGDEVVEADYEVPEFGYSWFGGPFTYNGVVYRQSGSFGVYDTVDSDGERWFNFCYKMVPDDGSAPVVVMRDKYEYDILTYVGKDKSGRLKFEGKEIEDPYEEVAYKHVIWLNTDNGIPVSINYAIFPKGSSSPSFDTLYNLKPIDHDEFVSRYVDENGEVVG